MDRTRERPQFGRPCWKAVRHNCTVYITIIIQTCLLKMMELLCWPGAGLAKLCPAALYCGANIFDNLQITAYWLSFRYLLKLNQFSKAPRLVGKVQRHLRLNSCAGLTRMPSM